LAAEEGEVAGKKPFPLWVANLLAFGVFFAASAGYHLWQMRQAKEAMEAHALAHASMVAGVIQRNAEAAVMTREATEDILKGLLGNTARFVSYLDQVEPFSSDELAAFSREAGLRGISINRKSGASVDGPAGWLQGRSDECKDKPALEHIQGEHLYRLLWPAEGSAACVAIGSEALRLEELQEQMGLAKMAKVLSTMPGIAYVKLGKQDQDGSEWGKLKLLEDEESGKDVVEVILPVASSSLSVGVDADYLTLFKIRLWRGFFIFSTALALFGAILSFLLYRGQKRELAGVRSFERELSRSREEASLGRAAAAISHEIKNSLNAVNMGLQRLQVESPLLSSENRRLMELMSSAVCRANATVTGLLRYARPPRPRIEEVSLEALVKNCLELYRDRAVLAGIRFVLEPWLKEPVAGDPSLLGQVVDNLVKNAIEAQPEGGFMAVSSGRDGEEGFLNVRNSGFALSPDDLDGIFEPYFTTKADGTGLGLSIASRIIKAHSGRMTARILEKDQLNITFYLPLWKGQWVRSSNASEGPLAAA